MRRVATAYANYRQEDAGCSIISIRFKMSEIDALPKTSKQPTSVIRFLKLAIHYLTLLLVALSVVVNTARGSVIRREAILNALRNRPLAGAELHVVEDEPLMTHKEAQTPNLIVTCHAAFCSV